MTKRRAETANRASRSKRGFSRYRYKVWQQKRVAAAHVLLLLILAVAIFADFYPIDANRQNLYHHLKAPTLSHKEGEFPRLLGTDPLGRDLLARLLQATRLSLLVGILAVAVACGVGTLLGLLAGFVGGILDHVIMRIADALLALPFVVLAIAIVAAIGPSFANIIFVLGLTGWVTFAKLVRAEVLRIREMDHVEAARAIGCSQGRLLFIHVWPQVVGLVLVTITLTLGQMIIAEATLSFLGLGIPPPTPTLGGILSDAQTYFFSAWWIVVFPGIFLVAIVLCANLIGDFLRDYLDPRLKL
jgi:peptide/nickel transport system permease protein